MIGRDKLSIIVPVYNGALYIEELITCLLEVNYENIEIILVNDGSNDNSKEVCETQKLRSQQIKLIEKKNGGIASARNVGLANASGRYVCFVDQDDIVDADVYRRAIKYMQSKNADFCFFESMRLYPDGSETNLGVVKEQRAYQEDSIFQTFIKPHLIKENKDQQALSIIGHVWPIVFSVDFLQKNNIQFEKFVDYEDDVVFILKCLKQAKNVCCIQCRGYYWKYNVKSESYRVKYIKDYFTKRKNYHAFLEKILDDGLNCDPELYEKFKFDCTVSLLIGNLHNECSPKNEQKLPINYLRELRSTEFPANPNIKTVSILSKYERILFLLFQYKMYMSVILLEKLHYKYLEYKYS